MLLSNPLMELSEGINKTSELNDVSVDAFEHAVKNMIFNCSVRSEVLQEKIGTRPNKDVKSIINILKDIVYSSIA
jgi:hypothetical protein